MKGVNKEGRNEKKGNKYFPKNKQHHVNKLADYMMGNKKVFFSKIFIDSLRSTHHASQPH